MKSLPFVQWFFRAAGLLTFVLLTSACSSLRRPPPVVDRTQDARILLDVRDRLASEPALDVEQLRVEVDGGVVLLYGSVRGISAWDCAIRNAQLVPGVRSVVDYLVIERGPREITCGAPREPLTMARILPPLLGSSERDRVVHPRPRGPGTYTLSVMEG